MSAGGFWIFSTVVPALGWLRPEILRVVYVLASYATFPIGFVVSRVVSFLVYYFILTPIGLVMRLTGYDSMRRRFDRDAKTYWSPHQQDESTERSFRQF